MAKLLESDFLTINLGSIVNRQAPSTSKTPETENKDGQPADDVTNKAPKATTKPITDWAKELKQRLDDNKQLSAEARKTEYEIEDQFWVEFFTAKFGENFVDALNSIDLLKSDIKKLGFNPQRNSILKFLLLNYVKNNLLITKLINSNTYKVIHNVVAKQLMATSELVKDSDYNIIYCRDLYTKPISDMEKYLTYQKEILPLDSSVYSEEMIKRNKEVFLQKGTAAATRNSGTKLRSLKEIKDLLGIKEEKSKEDTSDDKKQGASNAVIRDYTSNLTVAEVQATLQYISMVSGGGVALKALQNDVFSSTSTEKLMAATKAISGKISKITITNQNVENFVKILLNRVKMIG